jgi:hypothetical protein
MQLSEHFTLEELTVTNTGLDNTPDEEVIENLTRLCNTLLEPLRSYLQKPILVTSGYRSPEVNAKVGGTSNSAHQLGLAADIHVPDMTPSELAIAISHTGLPYDKAISEPTWVHVQVAPSGSQPRAELYTAVFTPGKPTTYVKGIV